MSRKNIYFVINPKIVFRREGKEAIVFNSETGSMETLNETGAYICGFCNGKYSIEDIIAKATDKYGKNNKKIRPDILLFIKKMKKDGLLEAGNEI